MVQSMTAFARVEAQGDYGQVIWEVRSVNHRFLDFSPRLPEALRALENDVRELAKQQLSRGKVDAFLTFQAGGDLAPDLDVNKALAGKLLTAAADLQPLLHQDARQLSSIDILRWPGIVQTAPLDLSGITDDIVVAFKSALTQLTEHRAREGNALAAMLEQRLTQISDYVAKLKAAMPDILKEQRQRITEALDSAKVQADENRLEQELVMVAQKADITEELDRLDTHVAEFRRSLQQAQAIGRRLDFLSQEMNREANTIGSKSISAVSSQIAVELKVLIEQVREQVQNIE